MTLGEKISACREKRGLSREALAERLKVDAQEVAAWETGEKEPGLEVLTALSQALGVSVDELLTGRPAGSTVELIRQKPDARAFMAAATACNILGLLLAVLLKSEIAFGIGLSLFIMGVAVYAIGVCVSAEESVKWVRKRFWVICIWFAAYWPAKIYSILFCQINMYTNDGDSAMTAIYIAVVIAYFFYHYINYLIKIESK